MNYEIIPACMPEHYDDIESAAIMVNHHVRTLQIDIMDGKYVPEKTWPFEYDVDYNLEDLKKEQGGFPLWEDLDYELDLMIQKPEESLDTWLAIGAGRVIFHYASVANWDPIRSIDTVTRNFTQIGLAVTIHDDLSQIYPLLDENLFDFIQVMGIDHIGYQGEAFEVESLEVIKNLRSKYPELTISVDGGVSEDTLGELKDAGASRFVSGSAIFGYGIAKENIQYLQEQVNEQA